MSGELKQFRNVVARLIAQIKDWAEQDGWVTKEYPKKMRDEANRIAEVPALFLQKGPTRVLLDPIAFDVPGTAGLVDLYLMPTYDIVASLYLEQEGWMVHYDFSPDSGASETLASQEVRPLSLETILEVLDSIAAHAEPSV